MEKKKIVTPYEVVPLSEKEMELYNSWADLFNEFVEIFRTDARPLEVFWDKAYMQFREKSRYGKQLLADIEKAGWKVKMQADPGNTINPPMSIYISVGTVMKDL